MDNTMKTLDNLWSKAILERDEYVDQWTGGSGSDPHHIFSRRSSLMNRHDMYNGITLSRENHANAHKNKDNEFSTFIQDKIGNCMYEFLSLQQSVIKIPYEVNIWYFCDYFETKKIELQEYTEIHGVREFAKQDVIDAINTAGYIKISIHDIHKSAIEERVVNYINNMDLLNAAFVELNYKYDMISISDVEENLLCSYPIHCLLEKELLGLVKFC